MLDILFLYSKKEMSKKSFLIKTIKQDKEKLFNSSLKENITTLNNKEKKLFLIDLFNQSLKINKNYTKKIYIQLMKTKKIESEDLLKIFSILIEDDDNNILFKEFIRVSFLEKELINNLINKLFIKAVNKERKYIIKEIFNLYLILFYDCFISKENINNAFKSLMIKKRYDICKVITNSSLIRSNGYYFEIYSNLKKYSLENKDLSYFEDNNIELGIKEISEALKEKDFNLINFLFLHVDNKNIMKIELSEQKDLLLKAIKTKDINILKKIIYIYKEVKIEYGNEAIKLDINKEALSYIINNNIEMLSEFLNIIEKYYIVKLLENELIKILKNIKYNNTKKIALTKVKCFLIDQNVKTEKIDCMLNQVNITKNLSNF